MILASSVMHLHIDRRLIGLDVGTSEQFSPHRSHYRRQQFADRHHPTAHRGPADVDAGVAQEDDALTKERIVVGIFTDDGIDDDPVRDQAPGDDPHRQRRHRYALLLTLLASPFLALDHFDEILGRLHFQHFADFVADHLRIGPAASAYALFRRAGNHPLHAGKIGGQSLAARMFAPLLLFRSGWQRVALALGGHFRVAHARLELQQFQLQIAQFLAAGTVLGDSLQPQLLFKKPDLQL
jgi:hypothetical protein